MVRRERERPEWAPQGSSGRLRFRLVFVRLIIPVAGDEAGWHRADRQAAAAA